MQAVPLTSGHVHMFSQSMLCLCELMLSISLCVVHFFCITAGRGRPGARCAGPKAFLIPTRPLTRPRARVRRAQGCSAAAAQIEVKASLVVCPYFWAMFTKSWLTCGTRRRG